MSNRGGQRDRGAPDRLSTVKPTQQVVKQAALTGKLVAEIRQVFEKIAGSWATNQQGQKDLYLSRSAVEREFGRLSHEWALLPLRVRGIDSVRLHADLTILAKLACRLASERALSLAA